MVVVVENTSAGAKRVTAVTLVESLEDEGLKKVIYIFIFLAHLGYGVDRYRYSTRKKETKEEEGGGG